MAEKQWKRPESVPYPSVWAVVEGKKPLKNGKIPRFKIQDVPKDLADDVVSHMIENFLFDEPTCSDLNLALDPVAISDVTALWKGVVKKGIALVALLDNHEELEDETLPEIAGVNMTVPKIPGTLIPTVRHHGLQHIFNMMAEVGGRVDCFSKYNVPVLMVALGLSVHSAFRGQGLGEHILRARIPLGKAAGISATSTVFTSPIAQQIAVKLGYEFLAEYKREDYKDNEGQTVFKGPKFQKMVCMSMSLQ